MKSKNIFWGLFFLVAAVFVIASQTGSFGELGLLSITATALLAALMIYSLFSRNFLGVFVPIAFLYLIYQKPYGLPDVSLWLLLLSAVLASIGFSIMFRTYPKKPECFNFNHADYSRTNENIDDNHPYAKVAFGSASKYLHADCLQSGQFIVSFGELEVYFDQATLDPSGAEIFLDCSFGAIKLYIPKHWQVYDSLHATLGGIENNNRLARPEANAPRLTLTGNVQLGGVEIQYI